VESVAVVNLMEELDEPLAIDSNGVEVLLKPFEIVTLKVLKGE